MSVNTTQRHGYGLRRVFSKQFNFHSLTCEFRQLVDKALRVNNIFTADFENYVISENVGVKRWRTTHNNGRYNPGVSLKLLAQRIGKRRGGKP